MKYIYIYLYIHIGICIYISYKYKYAVAAHSALNSPSSPTSSPSHAPLHLLPSPPVRACDPVSSPLPLLKYIPSPKVYVIYF